MPHLPYLKEVKYRPKQSVLAFSGLNQNDVIQDGEISRGKNLSLDNFPVITTRPSRQVLNTLTNPQAIIPLNNGKLAWIDGTYFYYDGILKGTVTLGRKSIVDFNGHIVIFPDKKYYDYISNIFSTFTAPNIDYACVHDNRIFGVKGSEIRASANGDFKKWDRFLGDELDSWAADVYSEGDFTGIAKYQHTVVIFKDDFQYELFGSSPSQFKVREVNKIGCIDHRSIVEVDNLLFFLSRNGIYKYNGGVPRLVSYNLNEGYLSSAASGDGRRYYISLQTQPNKFKLYVHDTWLDMWIPEDDLEVTAFTELNKEVYAVTKDKRFLKFRAGTESVEWELETKQFDEQAFSKKYPSQINIRVELEDNATFNVYVKHDHGYYKPLKSVNGTTARNIKINLPKAECETYQFKFSGKGKMKLYGLERFFYMGSDL